MRAPVRRRSLARRLLVLQLAVVALVVVPFAVVSVLRVRSATTDRERARVLSVAETVAENEERFQHVLDHPELADPDHPDDAQPPLPVPLPEPVPAPRVPVPA